MYVGLNSIEQNLIGKEQQHEIHSSSSSSSDINEFFDFSRHIVDEFLIELNVSPYLISLKWIKRSNDPKMNFIP